MTESKYDPQPLIAAIERGAHNSLTTGKVDYLPSYLPDLITAKNHAYYALQKGKAAMRPQNNGVLKATEADRSIEMDAKTADLRQEYQNLADLYDVCMVLVGE